VEVAHTVTIEIPTGHEPSPDVATAEAQADRARFGYQPALDGLRAVAVLGVLFYHGLVSWWRGGFLGVDVFFTLSGYLITTLLLMERDATSRIDLKGFWIRRARRLLPALFLVTAFVAAYGAFFAEPLELSSLRADSIASLFYVANWRFIFSGQSYFSALLAPSPVKHTWSLAIEEQWYLFWPIVFTLGYKFTKFRARNWAIGLLGFAALSGLLMAVLYHPGSDPSRVYYGTDTRAQPLLLGAALAFALQGRDLRRWPAWLLQSLTVRAGCTAADSPSSPSPPAPSSWG
jgi:peptidoglycan/LPS O-acetylase OafA/YrhL